jgi:hypothetical protein
LRRIKAREKFVFEFRRFVFFIRGRRLRGRLVRRSSFWRRLRERLGGIQGRIRESEKEFEFRGDDGRREFHSYLL